MNKPMSITVECEDCKHEFSISANDAANSLTNKKKYEIDGKSIFLTYYDCPSCGRRHYVQIDDTTSLNLLKKAKSMFISLCVARQKGKQITKKQQDKFKKARQHLYIYRTKLMNDYTDKSIHDDETDSDFVLRFSV